MLPTQAIDHHEKSADQAYFLLRQMIVSLKLEPGSLDRVLIVLTYHDIYWQPGGSPL